MRTKTQHEQFLILENNLKKSIFAKQTFELELVDVASKLEECQLKLAERDEKIKHLNEIGQSNVCNVQSSMRELEKLRGTEAKLQKELASAKLDLAGYRDRFEMQQNEYQISRVEFEKQSNERIESLVQQLDDKEAVLVAGFEEVTGLKSQLAALAESEEALRAQLAEKEETVRMLQNYMVKETEANSKKGSKESELKTDSDEDAVVVRKGSEKSSASDADTLDGKLKLQNDF